MRIAISQPTFLPWLGYFDLIDQVDCFVLLDTVQFSRQSWQQRNRIKSQAGLQWLNVPVISHSRLNQRIFQVEIRHAEFWRKHLEVVKHNYQRAPFFGLYFREFEELFQRCATAPLLVEWNVTIIRWLCGMLHVRTPLVRASEMAQEGRRSELLVNLARGLNASYYLAPLGSAAYLLSDLALFADAGIEVGFHNYRHPEYSQQFPPFCTYASAVDLIFNEGPRSLEIIRSGRGAPMPPSEVALQQNPA